ncbi:MAG: polysaccharide deacetylase family protein [Aestuariibacter sp.]
MLRIVVFCCCTLLSFFTVGQSATILIYHHVSSDTPPSTSISVAQFETHMALLAQEYHVISLTKLVSLLRNKQPIPDKSVVITFDDGFRNILQNAHPVLDKHGFPYTIFVNPVDVGQGGKMDWQELKYLQENNVTIANHFYDHRHLLDKREYANDEAWIADVRQLLLKAEDELQQHLGTSHKLLAYPYGEFNAKIQGVLQTEGFLGFAQHSGAVGSFTDLTAIPRFPAAGIYAGLNSLKVKLSSLNMPVLQLSEQPLDYIGKHQASYKMKLQTDDLSQTQLQCFYQGDSVPLSWQDDWVTISLSKTLTPGRHRVNCTAPSKSKRGRFYWHSQPWFIANQDGSWLE